jgi:hypothetical protein
VFIVKEPGNAIVVMERDDWRCKRVDLADPVSRMAVENVRTAAVWAVLTLLEIPHLVRKRITRACNVSCY